MKKLVFTAIAVIAFSGVSKAENLANENLAKESDEKLANEEILLSTDCDLAKFVAYNDARAAGLSVEDARSASYSVYFTCMGEAPISQ